jgi:uncharacterized protein (DUF1778 family)
MARLTLDIPDETHRKLKTLAAYLGMSMKDFLISRALEPVAKPTPPAAGSEVVNRVEELLFSESTTFKLTPEAWDTFCQALEAPPNPDDRLRKLMNSPSLLDG